MEQVRDAHVLVKPRPMDAFALAHDPPLAPFGRGAMRETGIPAQGDTHAAAILKDDGEGLVRHLDICRARGLKVSQELMPSSSTGACITSIVSALTPCRPVDDPAAQGWSSQRWWG